MIRFLRIINKHPIVSLFTGLILSVIPFGSPSIVSATNGDTPEDSGAAQAKRAIPITLKEAKPEDQENFEKFSVHPNQEDYLDLEEIPGIFQANKLKGLMGAYDKDGALVGLAYITKSKEGIMIEEFAIDKEFQGQGYGKAILGKLMNQLRSGNPNMLITAEIDVTNAPSQRLFKGQGFTKEGTPYYDAEDEDFYELWVRARD